MANGPSWRSCDWQQSWCKKNVGGSPGSQEVQMQQKSSLWGWCHVGGVAQSDGRHPNSLHLCFQDLLTHHLGSWPQHLLRESLKPTCVKGQRRHGVTCAPSPFGNHCSTSRNPQLQRLYLNAICSSPASTRTVCNFLLKLAYS